MKEFYVIKLGGNLYVATKAYGLFQETTEDLEHATKFDTEQEANKVLKKTIGGKIEKYYLIKNNEFDDKVGALEEIVVNQRQQIYQLKEELNSKTGNVSSDKDSNKKYKYEWHCFAVKDEYDPIYIKGIIENHVWDEFVKIKSKYLEDTFPDVVYDMETLETEKLTKETFFKIVLAESEYY